MLLVSCADKGGLPPPTPHAPVHSPTAGHHRPLVENSPQFCRLVARQAHLCDSARVRSHTCMHAYIRTCMHAYRHAYIHMHNYTCMNTCLQPGIHTHMLELHTFANIHTNTCIHTAIHTLTHTHTKCAGIYIRIFTCTQIHTHICKYTYLHDKHIGTYTCTPHSS